MLIFGKTLSFASSLCTGFSSTYYQNLKKIVQNETVRSKRLHVFSQYKSIKIHCNSNVCRVLGNDGSKTIKKAMDMTLTKVLGINHELTDNISEIWRGINVNTQPIGSN